jgi:hypothetical protein
MYDAQPIQVEIGGPSPTPRGGRVQRICLSFWSAFFVLVLGYTVAWGQATAQISGTVNDQSGAVLPGVEIIATQTDTGLTRTVISNETGSYVLSNLALGPYRLEASLPGFRTSVQTGIVLQVNSSPVINIALEVGQVSEQIEVQANAALVETQNSTVGTVIENERILELPLNGRNVTDLMTLGGGAVLVSNSGKGGGSAPMIAMAGGTGWGTAYTLDGANHIGFVTGSALLMPFPDAMQEFKVETGGVTAARGVSAGVAAVTKSGTNEFHGNLFEFLRNDLFNARSYFATSKSTLKRNQFGGTLGGPIVRNKLFFFGGYQATTLRSDPADVRTFVPTAAMLAGDWTGFTSPACNAGRQINLRAPFINNRIDPALYSKQALYIVNYRGAKPFPTTDDPCGEVRYSGSRSAPNEALYVGKIDYQQTDRHSLFGRIMIRTHREPNPWDVNTNLLQNTGSSDDTQSSYTMGSTYLISSTTVHAFRMAVNRTAQFYNNVEKGQLFNWCDIGVKIYCAPEITRINNMSITGAFSLSSGFLSGMKYVGNMYSVNDDISLVRGAHQIAFGGSATHGRQANLSIWASVHQFRFSGSAVGSGLADFMLGRPATLFAGRTNPHHVNGSTVALYLTDNWKATSRLNVNYGVRWDPYLPQNAEALYNFDYDRFRQGIKSTVFLNAPAGTYDRGDPGFPKNGVNPRWLQFAPGLGLAWDVSGDGTTSIRSSYSLGYVFVPGSYREGYSGGPPWGSRLTLSSPVGGLEDPWRDVPGGNIFPYELDKNAQFPPAGLYYTQPYDMGTPYSQTWNLSIQRQIGQSWMVSATYMGSNLMHAWGNKPLNPSIYFPGAADANGNCFAQGYTFRTTAGATCSTLGNTDARRRLTLERPEDGAKMAFVAESEDGGTQAYSGMVLGVERRTASGLSVNANYTFSHCISDKSNQYNPMSDHPDNTWLDENNRRFDRGNCLSDRRHIFNLTSVAETPQFANPTLRVLATGWRLSGIYRLSSGGPLDAGSGTGIILGSDRAFNGLEGSYPKQRPNQVLADPYGDKSAGPRSRFLNPQAFSTPDVGTLGNLGRLSIRGPRVWSFDMALSRVFRFRETQRLEFRAEAYNVTNSFLAQEPIADFSNANFGVIRESRDPRILQFALKYVF